MKHYRTSDLIAAVRELTRDHGQQYAEDCIWAALRYKLINIDQFTAAMKIIYP